jgi:hypothetical protein
LLIVLVLLQLLPPVDAKPSSLSVNDDDDEEEEDDPFAIARIVAWRLRLRPLPLLPVLLEVLR